MPRETGGSVQDSDIAPTQPELQLLAGLAANLALD
jgi:hypothetical protein